MSRPMTNLQTLVATQAALDVRTVLEACRDAAPGDASWVDTIYELNDDRLACALLSLSLLVCDNPAALAPFKRQGVKR